MNPGLRGLAGVEGLAGLVDLGLVAFCPGPDAAERLAQAKAKVGQAIIDARWDHRISGADQQAVTLHPAQGLGQHFLTDAGNLMAKGSKAHLTLDRQDLEDDHGPFVGYATNEAVTSA